MSKHVDLGIFLPVGNNGWILSKNSPQYLPTYALNRDVCRLAEGFGFEYVFSMAKWGGLDGETDYWNYTLESLTLSAALATQTQRMRLVASVSPLLTHPAIIAKMVATVDDVSGGRLSLNIVSSNNAEYGRLGLYPENWESFRYDYTYEWLTVIKRLWTEDRVDFEGKYFTLRDCMSGPKPVQEPHPPIVCATNSDTGFQFVVDECDEAFLGGATPDRIKAASKRAKAMAREQGKTVKTQTLLIFIPADTDEQGAQIVEHYRAGADYEAICNLWDAGYIGDKLERGRELVSGPEFPKCLFYRAYTLAGSPQAIADLIEDLAVDGDFDGLLLSFPDYIRDLKMFGEKIIPILEARGLR
jgi:pyrimidine oxygenase